MGFFHKFGLAKTKVIKTRPAYKKIYLGLFLKRVNKKYRITKPAIKVIYLEANAKPNPTAEIETYLSHSLPLTDQREYIARLTKNVAILSNHALAE